MFGKRNLYLRIFLLAIPLFLLLFNFTLAATESDFFPICDCCSDDTPCEFNDALAIGAKIMKGLLFLTFPITVIMIIYGGFMIMTARGSAGQVDKGKKILTYAVIGVIVAYGGYLIVDTILKTITEDKQGVEDFTENIGEFEFTP